MSKSTTLRKSISVNVRLPRRQRTFLTLLRALGARVPKPDFQKLLFLYCSACKERGSNPPYEFVPDHHGAYSFTSEADSQKLIARGVLSQDEDRWKLTPTGSRLAAREKDRYVAAFSRRYRNIRGEELIATTYRVSPFHATRSRIAERVLSNDPDAFARIAAERKARHSVRLATIGYEGRSYEGFFNCLLRAGITLLCDVRRNPVSRKWGFSKRMLLAGCDRLGIEYRHLPELGIASSRRTSLSSQAEYDRLFVEYQDSTLPTQEEVLVRIRGWIEAGESVALTCFERNHRQCHRGPVATAVADRPGTLLLPRHL